MIYSGFPLVEIFVAFGRTDGRTDSFIPRGPREPKKINQRLTLLSISTFFASISHLLLFGLIS